MVIDNTPDNESIWNYVSGVFEEVNPNKKLDIMAFVEEMYERTESEKRSPYMVCCSYIDSNIIYRFPFWLMFSLNTSRRMKMPRLVMGVLNRYRKIVFNSPYVIDVC